MCNHTSEVEFSHESHGPCGEDAIVKMVPIMVFLSIMMSWNFAMISMTISKDDPETNTIRDEEFKKQESKPETWLCSCKFSFGCSDFISPIWDFTSATLQWSSHQLFDGIKELVGYTEIECNRNKWKNM